MMRSVMLRPPSPAERSRDGSGNRVVCAAPALLVLNPKCLEHAFSQHGFLIKDAAILNSGNHEPSGAQDPVSNGAIGMLSAAGLLLIDLAQCLVERVVRSVYKHLSSPVLR